MLRHLAQIRRLSALCVLGLFAASLTVPAAGLSLPPALYQVEALQWVPSLLGSLNGKEGALLALLGWIGATLLAGRLYCSWMCPLGILQDIVILLTHPRRSQTKGAAIRYTPNHWVWRTLSALLSFGCLALGSVFVLSWLDPYTLSARFGAAVLHPLAAQAAAWAGADAVPDWERYAPALLLAACLSLLLPLALALRHGRLYCNTLCPVGAVLGLLSRWAPFAPHFRPEACRRCASCMRVCKAHAIDLKSMRVDTTRCVACYNCLGACTRGAITLRPGKGPTPNPTHTPRSAEEADPGRRAFLGVGLTSLATALWPEPPLPDLGQNPAASPDNTAPAAIPPGGVSVDRFLERCTGCGLCISACPTHVLRPSLTAHGWSGLMKPYMNYASGSCEPNCRQCSSVCPEGALLPLALADKKRTQIGLAQYDARRCRVWTEGVECTLCVHRCPTGALTAEEVSVPIIDAAACIGCKRCARVCPHGAISFTDRGKGKRPLAMVDYSRCVGCGSCAEACRKRHAIEPRRLHIPVLDREFCIGCGACGHICPSSPQKAFHILPRRRHLRAEEPLP